MKSLRLLALAVISAAASGYGPQPDPQAVFTATDSGNVVWLKKLAATGADLQVRDDQGRSLLFLATTRGNAAVVRYLLSQKLDVDARTMRGETSLHVAAVTGDARTAKLLLAAGASPRAYTKNCMMPLDYAAGFNQPQLFALLKGLTEKAPLPADGTVVECGLNRRIDDFATAQAKFYRRSLDIRTVDDYAAAADSLTFLASAPEVGARFIPNVLAAIDRPAIPGTELKGLYDSMTRDMAVKTLHKLAKTKAQKELVARGLMVIVQRGPCTVYTQTVCKEASCAPMGSAGLLEVAKSILINKKASWPRSAEDEVCYNCAHCSEARVGHSYDAALAWFAANPAYRPQAEAALRRQAKAQVLGPVDLKAKLRMLQVRRPGF